MLLRLWRLYRQEHGPGLDGMGGLLTSGRWHKRGSRVVYFGASPGVVILEKLAHIDPVTLPSDLVLARFEGTVSMDEIMSGEVTDLNDLAQTQTRGERFLKEGKAAILRVPSVIVPEEYNLMLNPLHPEAAHIQPAEYREFKFDARLL